MGKKDVYKIRQAMINPAIKYYWGLRQTVFNLQIVRTLKFIKYKELFLKGILFLLFLYLWDWAWEAVYPEVTPLKKTTNIGYV